MFTEEKKNSQIFQDSNDLAPKSEAEVSDIIKESSFPALKVKDFFRLKIGD